MLEITTPPDEMTEKSLPELIDEFEREITCGCHSLRAEVSRSSAGKEIVSRGPQALIDVARQLNARHSGIPGKIQLQDAWGLLMAQNRVEFREVVDLPSNSSSLRHWLKWLYSQGGLIVET